MVKGILLNNTSTECHIGSKNVINNIGNLCLKNGIKLTESYTRHNIMSFKTRPRDLKKLFNSCDIVIINGEGSLHHYPNPNTKWFEFVLDILPENKAIVLINALWQGMEKIKNLEKKLDKLNLISVRESYSYNNLIKFYPRKEKIFIVPDMIFADNQSLINVGYGDSVHKSLRTKMKRHINYFPLSSIHTGTYDNIKEFNMPSMVTYLGWLKTLDTYITGRFHGVCLASMAGVPFLALSSNSHKIQSILHDMNCSELLIDSLEDVSKNIGKAKTLIGEAKNYAIDAKFKIEELFLKIGELV